MCSGGKQKTKPLATLLLLLMLMLLLLMLHIQKVMESGVKSHIIIRSSLHNLGLGVCAPPLPPQNTTTAV